MAAYKFKEGFAPSGIDAEVVEHELERIAGKEQRLTPNAIVDAARPKDAVLHKVIFRLNRDQAAQEHYLDVARRLIRSVVVVHEDEKRPSPVWVHVPANDGGKAGDYQPAAIVVQRPDAFAAALAELQRRLNSARNAVDDLQRVAAQSEDPERLALIAMAVKALETAGAAVQAIH